MRYGVAAGLEYDHSLKWDYRTGSVEVQRTDTRMLERLSIWMFKAPRFMTDTVLKLRYVRDESSLKIL